MMNRLEAASSVIDIQSENLRAAESRVSDVDVATEMAALTRNQVLAQAGISMLAQANSMPQMVALSMLDAAGWIRGSSPHRKVYVASLPPSPLLLGVAQR